MQFLAITTDIDQSTTQAGLIHKIALGLRYAIYRNEKAIKLFEKSWHFLQRLEVAGTAVRRKAAPSNNEALLEEAAYSLSETVNAFTTETIRSQWGINRVYDGVLLLLDEADNAGSQLQLGSFAKLLLERLQRLRCERFLFGMAGLPRVREVLYKSHGSALRAFEEIDLGPLSDTEVNRVIDSGLEAANSKNTTAMAIDPEARGMLVRLSEGLPHFIQQFCFSAFDDDSDWRITTEDVQIATTREGGALDQIGARYYRDAFFNKLQNDHRQVLKVMASLGTTWISKDQLRTRIGGPASTLNKALRTMVEKNILVPKEGDPGIYRLVNRGFGTWIQLRTTSPEDLKELSGGPSEG